MAGSGGVAHHRSQPGEQPQRWNVGVVGAATPGPPGIKHGEPVHPLTASPQISADGSGGRWLGAAYALGGGRPL